MKKFIINIIEIIVVCAIVFGITRYVVVPVRIIGGSMDMTLQDGEIAVMNRLNINKDSIKRFDIVVVYSDQLHENVIKRVIGLPGDHLVYSEDHLIVNDIYVDEPFLNTDYVKEYQSEGKMFTENFDITLGGEEFFIMGDNRINSADSRTFGTITADEIVGVNGMVIYPFEHMMKMGE